MNIESEELQKQIWQLQKKLAQKESNFLKAYHRAEQLQIQNERLSIACRGLIEYRDRSGSLNFQLEKADDFIRLMRIALEGEQG
jgi:hypothetical protein